MAFINETGIIGTILDAGTQNATGSMMATLLLILLILLVVCFMFGIPLEFASILLLPICITMGSYYSDMFRPIIVILIYIALILCKNWIFK